MGGYLIMTTTAEKVCEVFGGMIMRRLAENEGQCSQGRRVNTNIS